MNTVVFKMRRMQYREGVVRYAWAPKNQPRRKKTLIRRGSLIRAVQKTDKKTYIIRLHKTSDYTLRD